MSSWSRLGVILLLCLVSFGLIFGLTQTVAATGTSDPVDPDWDPYTEFVVDLDSSGDATWEIREVYNLTSDAQVNDFETVATAFEDGENDLGYETFEYTADEVDETVDRQMTLTNVERTSRVAGEGVNRTGYLTLSFTWENFAERHNDQLIIGDVLTTENGLWFRGLEADQELVIRPPAEYGVENASVAPENGQLKWVGPVDFTMDSLQATFVGTEDQEEGEDSGLTGIIPFAFLGFAFVVTVLVLAVVRRDQFQTLRENVFGDEGTASPTKSPDASERTPATSATKSAQSADQEEPIAGSATDDDHEVETDMELLSDEERVVRLLEHNGGRMKQAQIVKETGWSNAKVSQLLSAMEEEDEIDKLRIGRENLISFPDEDVTGNGSDS